MPLLAVKEVIAVPPITPLPEAPRHFLGVINLRGQIISVVDLRIKLQPQNKAGRDAESTIIILELNNSLNLGVLVDSVNSVLAFEDSQISPCPTMDDGTKAAYLSGVAKAGTDIFLMVDVGKLFSAADRALALSSIPADAEKQSA